MNKFRYPAWDVHPNKDDRHADQRTPLQHSIQERDAKDDLDWRVQDNLQEVSCARDSVEVGRDEVVEAALETARTRPLLSVCFLCIIVRRGAWGSARSSRVLHADAQRVLKDELCQNCLRLNQCMGL